MNVMPESIRAHIIRWFTTVLYTHTRYNPSMMCYTFIWSLNLYAHIFQGYLTNNYLSYTYSRYFAYVINSKCNKSYLPGV